MKRLLFIILVYCIHVSVLGQEARPVLVNGQALAEETISILESAYRVKIIPGRYWYDKISGFWGLEGQQPAGIMLAGLNLGGHLQEDASNGDTQIFINGREITKIEMYELIKISGTPVAPGRYWMDAQGWAGKEGQAAIANIYYLANQYYGSNNGNSFYRNGYTDMGSGGNSEGFYIIGEDFSYSDF